MSVSFDVSAKDDSLIVALVDFAIEEFSEMITDTHDKIDFIMDVTACHANGCPLNLQGLIETDVINRHHDLAGIARNIDKATGKLLNNFLPRFAK